MEYYDAVQEVDLNDSTILSSPLTTSGELNSSLAPAPPVSSGSSEVSEVTNYMSGQPWEVEQAVEIDKCSSFFGKCAAVK